MKEFESIYKQYNDILQKLLKTVGAYDRITNLPFIPADILEQKYLRKIEKDHKAILINTINIPNNFDLLVLKAENPNSIIYSIDILLPQFKLLLEESNLYLLDNVNFGKSKKLASSTGTPLGWSFSKADKKAYIQNGDHVIFTFPTIGSDKLNYFEALWNSYGNFVSFKDIYEYNSNREYSHKISWKVNKAIRDVLIKLTREKNFKDLPFRFTTQRGSAKLIDK